MTDVRAVYVIIEEFNKFVDECDLINKGSVSARIQLEQIEKIDSYVEEVRAFKYGAISAGEEGAANMLLNFQCTLRAVQSSIRTWICFKEEKYHDAWKNLIDAQDYADIAVKAANHTGTKNLTKKLNDLELLLFPGFGRYLSAGFTETVGNCSVCGAPFLNCDHLEGEVYMGRYCRRINRSIIDAQHVAIVERPRDRRCIIPKFENERGKMVDKFTLEETSDAPVSPEGERPGRHAEGIILAFTALDLD